MVSDEEEITILGRSSVYSRSCPWGVWIPSSLSNAATRLWPRGSSTQIRTRSDIRLTSAVHVQTLSTICSAKQLGSSQETSTRKCKRRVRVFHYSSWRRESLVALVSSIRPLLHFSYPPSHSSYKLPTPYTAFQEIVRTPHFFFP